MTQPPEDRPRPPDDSAGTAPPDDSEGAATPDDRDTQASPDEPTVAWTPPGSEADKPAEEGGVGYAAIDQGPSTPAEGAPPTEPPEPASPIISASPSAPSAPGTPDIPAAVAPPGGGWQAPAAAAAVEQRDGYVIAGVGARFVAWLVDVLLAGVIPIALSLAIVDWNTILRDAIDQARLDPSGQIRSFSYQIPITLDYVLLTLIGLGVQFLYFVGFWTSGLRATPGMIGLKMRVVDAGSGSTLSVVQATKRWLAMGWPLGLLVLIPALQNSASLIQFAWVLVLFFTTVLHERKQGLHDRYANSLVVRSVTSGDGATVVGCLVWIALVILLTIIVSSIFLATVLPELQDFIREIPQNTI
jgi:uncharacterized RDD family membrane protein YckC